MGTRGLVGHIVRGRRKGAYNHFDSYPIGLGVKIVEFLKSLSPEQVETMIRNLENIEWVDINATPSQELQDRYVNAGFENLDVNVRSPADWYCLLHKVQGAAALPRILDGTLGHLVDQTDFEKDELFCEWVYWIDWDQKTLTVSGRVRPRQISFADLSLDWMQSLQYSYERESEPESEPETNGVEVVTP